MSVRQAMAEIDRAVEESLDTQTRYEVEKDGRSRWRVYGKSIEAVRDTAGRSEAGRLAAWVAMRIREEGELPPGRAVRKRGADICRDAGHSVSTNDWLGA